jgi:hypothetical protein
VTSEIVHPSVSSVLAHLALLVKVRRNVSLGTDRLAVSLATVLRVKILVIVRLAPVQRVVRPNASGQPSLLAATRVIDRLVVISAIALLVEMPVTGRPARTSVIARELADSHALLNAKTDSVVLNAKAHPAAARAESMDSTDVRPVKVATVVDRSAKADSAAPLVAKVDSNRDHRAKADSHVDQNARVDSRNQVAPSVKADSVAALAGKVVDLRAPVVRSVQVDLDVVLKETAARGAVDSAGD